MTNFLVRGLEEADSEALRQQAEAEGVSMNDIALRAIRDATSRRAKIKAYVARAHEKHADTLAELADR